MGSVDESIGDEISGAAFRRLLRTGTAVAVAELACDLSWPVAAIAVAIKDMSGKGRLCLDRQGRVTGSAGLSVRPDRHQIEIESRRFWTWCAYDILGIFWALGTSGLARSTDPLTGVPLTVRFHLGRPEPSSLVLFRPDDTLMNCCANVYEEWCPNSNFFESTAAATTWSQAQGLDGCVLPLAEAAESAAKTWEPLVSPRSSRGSPPALP